jgi:hypothetical protein
MIFNSQHYNPTISTYVAGLTTSPELKAGSRRCHDRVRLALQLLPTTPIGGFCIHHARGVLRLGDEASGDHSWIWMADDQGTITGICDPMVAEYLLTATPLPLSSIRWET